MRVDRSRKASPERTADQILTTKVGLRFPPGVTFEQWADAGTKLARLVDSLAWCVGDWLVYGQQRHHGRYAETAQMVGLDHQTLRNYAWVAGKFDMTRRREGLSFQHHAEVASLPPKEQDEWLDRAEQHNWSRNRLRLQLREARNSHVGAAQPSVALPRLRVDEGRLRAWHLAADRNQADLQSWIVETLEHAAARAMAEGTAVPLDHEQADA